MNNHKIGTAQLSMQIEFVSVVSYDLDCRVRCLERMKRRIPLLV